MHGHVYGDMLRNVLRLVYLRGHACRHVYGDVYRHVHIDLGLRLIALATVSIISGVTESFAISAMSLASSKVCKVLQPTS